MKRKVGRPTKITPKIQQEILDRLSRGETARSVCRLDHMPDWVCLCRFKRKTENEFFNNQFTQSRREGMLFRMDEMWETVNDSSKDIMYEEREKLDPDGNVVSSIKIPKSDNTPIFRHRLMAEQLRWESARIYRDLFGDKIQQEVTGAGGAAFVPVLNIKIEK